MKEKDRSLIDKGNGYLYRVLDGFLFLFITLLLIYDYFPTFFLKEVIPQNVIFLLLLGMLFINAINKNKQTSPEKDMFKSQLVFLLYVFILMFALNLAGGESTVGLSFENRIFWIVVSIALVQLVVQWKRMKREGLERG
ncbi:hypothetical protein [Guptibacillus sedimenti]|uniref:hypothetical protein n=1 Tax=Guptibacillus sedimenti TaxID=3025680 RepID=UPI002361EBFA|nr:hypothetical protein [Pseudalkalibacillus sedimenti]